MGGGVRHHQSVSKREKGDLGKYISLNVADSSSLSEYVKQLSLRGEGRRGARTDLKHI